MRLGGRTVGALNVLGDRTDLGTDMEDSFRVLRDHSRRNRRPLTEVSRDITTGRLGSEDLL